MLDTSTEIRLGEPDDPTVPPDGCVISAVRDLGCAVAGPHVAPTARDRSARQRTCSRPTRNLKHSPLTPRQLGRSAEWQRRYAQLGASLPPAPMTA